MPHVITVCTGNICRSPMAEYLIRASAREAGLDDVVVTSSGISDEEEGNGIDPRARSVLVREGIDPSGHRARQFRPEDFGDADLVLALDLPHARALRGLARTDADRAKIRLLREFDPAVADRPQEELGISDPWYGGPEDFETAYGMIRDAVPGVLAHLEEQA